jgi:uncharacterized membrane protein
VDSLRRRRAAALAVLERSLESARAVAAIEFKIAVGFAVLRALVVDDTRTVDVERAMVAVAPRVLLQFASVKSFLPTGNSWI